MRTVRRVPVSADYITGLVEAAGSFTFSRSRGQLSIYFAIRLGAKDVAVLRNVRQYFGGRGRIQLTILSGCIPLRADCWQRVV